MSTPRPTIGFCGLGLMGFGMATHLLKQGYPVKGFDVFAKTMERWVAAGGIPATSLAESATDVQFYVCMVASAPQAQIALFGEEGGGSIVKGVCEEFCLRSIPCSMSSMKQFPPFYA